jgi:hypothetical protein
MSSLRAITSGATMASAPFSSAIGTPNLAIRGGAAASTILRCDRAGGKTWRARRTPSQRIQFWRPKRRAHAGCSFRLSPRASTGIRPAPVYRISRAQSKTLPRRRCHWSEIGVQRPSQNFSWRAHDGSQQLRYLLKINTANASVIIENAIVDVQDGGSDLNTKVSAAAIITSDRYNSINLTKSSPRLGRMSGFPATRCPNLILDAAINPSMSAVVFRNGTSR